MSIASRLLHVDLNRLGQNAKSGLERARDWVLPPRCAGCGVELPQGGALCADCWSQATFITGLTCSTCGTPLPGEGEEDEQCDTCIAFPPPWRRGAAAMSYDGIGRKLVLALKHGDRTDLAPDLANWMSRAARPFASEAEVVIPVPLHWKRFWVRRYNQAAEIARHVSREVRAEYAPDALVRIRATPRQDRKDRDARFENLRGAIKARGDRVKGRRVLLVDDVMTTGATLSACADTCIEAGAKQVDVVVFARVAQRD